MIRPSIVHVDVTPSIILAIRRIRIYMCVCVYIYIYIDCYYFTDIVFVGSCTIVSLHPKACIKSTLMEVTLSLFCLTLVIHEGLLSTTCTHVCAGHLLVSIKVFLICKLKS